MSSEGEDVCRMWPGQSFYEGLQKQENAAECREWDKYKRRDSCRRMDTGLWQWDSGSWFICVSQNASARLLTGTTKFDPMTLVLKTLHWWRREEISRCWFLYIVSCMIETPEYMRDMLQERTNVWTLCSSPQGVPWSRLKGFGDRAFSIVATRLWNPLPGSITDCKSIGVLKKKL